MQLGSVPYEFTPPALASFWMTKVATVFRIRPQDQVILMFCTQTSCIWLETCWPGCSGLHLGLPLSVVFGFQLGEALGLSLGRAPCIGATPRAWKGPCSQLKCHLTENYCWIDSSSAVCGKTIRGEIAGRDATGRTSSIAYLIPQEEAVSGAGGFEQSCGWLL